MNDNDLERRLRAESGPREHGYLARNLPTSIGDPPVSRRGPSLLRMAAVVPAVAAGIVAVAVAAALLSRPQPGGVGSGIESPRPSDRPTTEPPGLCIATDMGADAEDWGAAAGSRGTVVTIGSTQRGGECLLDQPFTVAIKTRSGVTLVEATSPPAAGVMLGPPYRVGISWSNWCGATINGPLQVTLGFRRAGELTVEPAGEASAIPPCLGDGQPASISVTELQPAN